MLVPHSEPEPDERHHDPAPDGSDSNHGHLRRATRQWHLKVDRHYTNFDLSKREKLAVFLLQHARALPPLESAIAASGAWTIVHTCEERRREYALSADLRQLGLAMPPPACAPDLPSGLHGVGALYVLEGAKLGGRVLLRQVETSPDPRVRAARRFLGEFDSKSWRAFLAGLNGLPSDASSRAALVAGACAAFAAFLPPSNQPMNVPPPIRLPGSGLVQSGEA